MFPIQDGTILKNPERGFYKDVESYASKLKPIALSDLQDYWSKDQVSLILINYVLDKFVTSDISSTFLNTITADMATLRKAGMKAVLRFSYTQTEGNKNDAAITQLLKHIAQIKPILQVCVK
jgi:Domain of unknown function (DUF4874)